MPMKLISMSRRLTLALALAMTLASVLVTTSFYQFTAVQLEKTFNQKVEQTLSFLDGMLAPVLWSFDHDTVMRVAQTTLRDDLVVGVTIRDQTDMIIFSEREHDSNGVLFQTKLVRFQDEKVGELDVFFSRTPLVTTLTNILWISLSVWVLALLSITILTYFFIRKYFRGPLASFIDLAQAYRQNPESPPLSATPYLEFQPIEAVVKELANDVFIQLRELREREAYYRSIFENSLYGIAITGPDAKFTKVNDAWCKLIGYTEDELLGGMGVADVTLPDNLPESMQLMEKLTNLEVRQGRLEKRYKTKSGKIIAAMTFIKGIYDRNGQYLGNAASILDITERKQAEEELVRYREHLEDLVAARTQELEMSEEKYHILYDHSPGLLISVDVLTKQVVECNETLLQRLGYARNEIIGKKIFNIYHPDSFDAAQKAFNQLLATDEVHNAELQLVKKDGGKIDVLLDATAHVDKKTGRKITLSIWRDITEHKLLERNIIHAKEEAERANQAKSIFLANMSHELRTPLNAVLGFSEMLARDPQLNEKQKENLNIINRSGSYLLALINNVLDMSKIEAGRVELELASVDLSHLMHDVSDMMRPRAEAKHLQFVLELSPGLPQNVQVDMEKLRQVLINLLGNAIKFTEAGSVILRADADDLSNGKWQLHFEIEDTGLGIPADEIGDIFEPFMQAGHSASKQQGTGLGLAISRQFIHLIHLMRGDITVQSTINKGSVFRFEIPTETATADDIKKYADETKQRVVGLAVGEPEWRILVVEDDFNNRLLLSRLLAFVGFKVYEAENGEEAIQQFKDWQPHLIWMDIRMPVMDGYEATRRIRALPGGEQVIILALTASAFKDQEEKFLAVGCNAVYHKPYDEPTIFAAMKEQLDLHYIYEDVSELPNQNALSKLCSEDLQNLPDAWLVQFLKTARLGDSETMLILTSKLAAEHAKVKAKLDYAIHEFQFQAMVKILEEKIGSSE
jgi:PAS domain S-box-containing protein